MARLRVRGAAEAHGEIARDPERALAECHARANDVGGIWLERVIFETRPRVDAAALLERDDALGALLRGLGAERYASDEVIQELALSLADLDSKLPARLKNGPDSLSFTDPETIRAFVRRVEETLLAKLTGEGG